MNFSEDLLHFIWQFRLYGKGNLQTTRGEVLEVIHPGNLNTNAGPDFSNAKLIIAGTTWAGNVEVHIRSSDWNIHQHQYDRSYENVILHVVYENDQQVYRTDGTVLPELVLKDLFPPVLLYNYENLVLTINNFSCEQRISTVDDFSIRNFLSRILVERLLRKSEEIEEKLTQLKGDWDSVFYYFLARNFGFKVNAIPMEMLAQSLPHHLFAKHKDQPLHIEALIFGQAGFLTQKFSDEYPKQLKREYLFLKKKYNLEPLPVSLWKFMRMRPQNFPTLRLAQFAALIVNSNHLLANLLVIKSVEELFALFSKLPVHSFWETHYHFHKQNEKVNTQPGDQSVNSILINTVIPLLFAYGRIMDQYDYVHRAISLLETLPKENNSILTQYSNAGVFITNAFESQALLELRNKYCDLKKCLHCAIGASILRKGI